MLIVHTVSLYLHIAIGTIGLIVFWLPVFARKGSPFHQRAGRWFAWGMYAVSVSGVLMSSIVLIDPIGIRYPDTPLPMAEAFQRGESARMFAAFLLMLSFLVLASVRQAVMVLKVRDDRARLRKPAHLALQIAPGLVGVIVGYYGIVNSQLLLIIFAAISIVATAGTLRYIFKPSLSRNEWWIAHMGNIIGAGIGAYTAFFAFGGRALFSELLSGQWVVVPWILPSIIGVSFISVLARRYRRRFAKPVEQRA